MEQVVKTLIEHAGNKQREIIMALLFIVRAIKKQPGFDVAGFDKELLDSATSLEGPDSAIVRLILEAAGGKIPSPPAQQGEA